MRITVEWDDEAHTILRYTYAPHWTWDDYEVVVAQAVEMVNATRGETLIDVIADFSESSLLPELALSNFRRSLNNPNSVKFGVAVTIMHNQYLLRMLEVFRRLNTRMTHKIRSAATLEEARAIIAEVRAKRVTSDTAS